MCWKRLIEALLLLAVLAVDGGCRPEASGALLPTDYRSWSRFPEKPLDYPIPGHLSSDRVIYINEQGAKARVEQDDNRLVERYPAGTTIIKEIYPGRRTTEGQLPKSLSAMIKAPAHDQARGGWLWIVKDIATGREQIIDYELCFDCHTDANGQHPYGDGNPDREDRDNIFLPYRLFVDQ
jgi:hypothetical protein